MTFETLMRHLLGCYSFLFTVVVFQNGIMELLMKEELELTIDPCCSNCHWWKAHSESELGTCCIMSGVFEHSRCSQDHLPKSKQAILFSETSMATVETGRDHGCRLFKPKTPPKEQPAVVEPFDPFDL